MKYDAKKWIYENDDSNSVRYVLGTRGDRPLLCFGVNPSTARPNDLDNTLKSVERLSNNNGFDSWIMMNLYPQRDKDPNNIHEEINEVIHRKNLQHIESIISQHQTVIWAAWGTLISTRPYLTRCLLDISELTQKYNCKWVSIGTISKDGHPHHPLYVKKIEKTVEFDIAEYINNL